MPKNKNVQLQVDTSDLPQNFRTKNIQALLDSMRMDAAYAKLPVFNDDAKYSLFRNMEPGIYSARPEDSKYRGLSRLFDEWWGGLDDSSRKEFDRRLNVKESYPDFWNGMYDILNGEIAPDDFERFRLLDWYDSIWNEKNERPRRMVPSERKKYNKEHGIWFEY
ncbi:hypothetical protein [Fibrobacter sp.]|uniref:hypothetical protein n=1 Tax=Fibrobacter sp. TaxID=35828 RepID=UPI0025BB3B27|nr:hypothetical protein [Fibrobacter sp.]MBR4008657.1 hypothetical protein [Fibrobacter sp.]